MINQRLNILVQGFLSFRLHIQVHETRNIRDRKRLLKSMLRKEGSSETEGDSDHHASGNGHAIFKEKDIR